MGKWYGQDLSQAVWLHPEFPNHWSRLPHKDSPKCSDSPTEKVRPVAVDQGLAKAGMFCEVWSVIRVVKFKVSEYRGIEG